jgi:hypothetical protein
MPNLELFSVVALLRDIPEQGLSRGQVGTIVEIYSPSDAEVEFVDSEGQTYGLTTLRADDLIRLHHQPLAQFAA